MQIKCKGGMKNWRFLTSILIYFEKDAVFRYWRNTDQTDKTKLKIM